MTERRETLEDKIEHIGSTAVPGLAAKPVVDVLVEVADPDETRERIASFPEAQGYDHFWRSSRDDGNPPFYAWFIKRDGDGHRAHRIHMVEALFEPHWARLLFRDYRRCTIYPDCDTIPTSDVGDGGGSRPDS